MAANKNPMESIETRLPVFFVPLCLLKNLGLLANQVEQTQSRAGGLPSASLPTDGRHLGYVEQGGEDGLADVKLSPNRALGP